MSGLDEVKTKQISIECPVCHKIPLTWHFWGRKRQGLFSGRVQIGWIDTGMYKNIFTNPARRVFLGGYTEKHIKELECTACYTNFNRRSSVLNEILLQSRKTNQRRFNERS